MSEGAPPTTSPEVIVAAAAAAAPAPTGVRVLMCGHTGATGREVVPRLVGNSSVSRVFAIGRRELPFTHEKLAQRTCKDMCEIPADIAAAAGQCDTAICCLGTTRKDAGSDEAFRKVDLHAVVSFAKLAKASGCRIFLLISSTGADAKSMFLYLRTKGEVEAAVSALGFEKVAIFRPGFLGRGSQARWNERFIGFFTAGLPVEILAQALVNLAVRGQAEASNIYTNDTIRKLAEK